MTKKTTKARKPAKPETSEEARPLFIDEAADGARTLSGKAYDVIRRAILECRIPPSAIIDERALMNEYKLGRTPIREALLKLSSERLVLFRARQVIQVAPIGATDIRDLYELRLHSERLAARLMMERRTPELVESLTRCFDSAPTLLAQGRIRDVIGLDFRFHALLYEGAKNQFLSTMLRNLFGHSYRLWLLTSRGGVPGMDAIVRSHEPIVDAIRTGDAERLDAEIAEHIASAYDRVISVLRGTTIDNLGTLRPLSLEQAKGAKPVKTKR